MSKPDCYKCIHRRILVGDAHSLCTNMDAKVQGNSHGVQRGWFMWPFNFDPIWLDQCDGFKEKPAELQAETE